MRTLATLTAVAGFGLTLALTLGVLSPTAMAGGMKMAKAVTITGTLIDTKCYGMNAMNKGQDHMTPKGQMKGCATACAAMGIPVAVLTAEGKVHVLIAPANLFAKHMAKTARVTGAMAFGGSGIIAKKVQVKEGSSWIDVPVVTMM